MKEISLGTFKGCTSLNDLTISEGVTSIGMNAFENCVDLYTLKLPESLEKLSAYAFSGCISLTSVSIPANLTDIESGAFSACTNLKEINVVSENTAYTSADGVLFTKDMTAIHTYPAGKYGNYEIPSGVTAFAEDAFDDCSQTLEDYRRNPHENRRAQ